MTEVKLVLVRRRLESVTILQYFVARDFALITARRRRGIDAYSFARLQCEIDYQSVIKDYVRYSTD